MISLGGASASPDYFALLLQDGFLDDFADGYPSNYKPNSPMGHLRFHLGATSHGCVSVPPGQDNTENWNAIRTIMNATELGSPIVIHGESFPNFGTFTIRD